MTYQRLNTFLAIFSFLVLGGFFHPLLASKISIYFRFYPLSYFHQLPSSWFYNHPKNLLILLAIMSFSAFFIAPLNSFSNVIKDGNLLQVNYVKEKFSYNIIARYLSILTSAILVQNFLFSIFCLAFIVIDILIFYKRYTKFLFQNTNVLTNFLAKKIRQENETRKIFFEIFDETKRNITRFEKKYHSLDESYNSILTLKTNRGVQELEKKKFRFFLYLMNNYLNYEKKDSKKIRYFRSRVFFDFRRCQVTLSVDFIDKNKDSGGTSEKIKQKLEKKFIDCFEYLPKDYRSTLIPHLTENLDVHFFDLYQKNEFKSLFTNIDLLREAIAKSNLKVGEGIYDILYFFSRLILYYPEMNQTTSFNDKLYKLWLAIFEKSLELDKNIIEFCLKNLTYAIEKGFISEEYYPIIKKDLSYWFQQKSKNVNEESLFGFFYSMIHMVIYLQKKNISDYKFILEFIFFFDKEFSMGQKIKLQNGLESIASNYAKEGLLLLAAYYFHQKKKTLAFQIFSHFGQDFFLTFISLARSQEKIRQWHWAEWFRGEYVQNTISPRISLLSCLYQFVLDRIKQQKNYDILVQLEYQEEDVEWLQEILILLGRKNKKLQNILLEGIYQGLNKEQTPLNQKRVCEFIHCCKIGYASVLKLSDILTSQLQKEVRKNIGSTFQIDKQIFFKNEALKLEDFETYGEDLAIVENKKLKTDLKKKLITINISYQKFFQRVFLDIIQKPEIEVIFFGDFHQFTQFFVTEKQSNVFQKELTLAIQKKKQKTIYSAFYMSEIIHDSYIVSYQSQKKNCYFLPDNRKKGLDVLLYYKKDNLKVHYYQSANANEDNLVINHIDYKISSYNKSSGKNLKKIQKRQEINIQPTNQKLFSTKIEFEANVAPKIIFSQKRYLSCMYHIIK